MLSNHLPTRTVPNFHNTHFVSPSREDDSYSTSSSSCKFQHTRFKQGACPTEKLNSYLRVRSLFRQTLCFVKEGTRFPYSTNTMNPTNPQEDNNPGVVASLVEKIEAKESGHPTTNPRFKVSTTGKRSAPRQTTSLYDANGFRIKRQQMDAKETTPSEQVGQAIKGVSNEITIADEVAQGAKYVIDGNLRRVPPYYFTYLTFCKERWRDRNIFELFTSEFRDRDAAYYKQAIERGQVTVNKKVANLDTIIRNGDQISHRTHKHEPPVTSSDIRIVFEDDELCVIDKPSGMPVHPTGRYRFNSVVQILKHEQNKNVHRE